MSFLQRLKTELAEEKKLPKKRSFVRKCFITNGAVSNPERTYHLEFSLTDEEAAKLKEILESFGLHPKKMTRKGQTVVYLKESDEISDCLKIMGAAKNLLHFEELRVKKQVRNNVNRKVNFEAANLSKTASAALDQIETIKSLDAKLGLSNLPKALSEVAKLRLANDNLTLQEIGTLLTPPLSKSGVNHRMRKLKKLLV